MSLKQPYDKLPYDKKKYEDIRDKIEKSNLAPDLKDEAIHYSFCMQNLHKNFESQLKSMLEYYNDEKNKKTLPKFVYFEPTSKSFPPKKDTDGNKLSDDGLRVFERRYVHHANLYPMSTLAITWNGLLNQYHASAEYAIQRNRAKEWAAIIGDGGCFEAVAAEMHDWALKNQEVEELKKEHKIAYAADTEQMVEIAEKLIPTEIKGEIQFAEDYLIELKKVVALRGDKKATDEDILIMIDKILYLDTKSSKQISQENKIRSYFQHADNFINGTEDKNNYKKAYQEINDELKDNPKETNKIKDFDEVIVNFSSLIESTNDYKKNRNETLLKKCTQIRLEIQDKVGKLSAHGLGYTFITSSKTILDSLKEKLNNLEAELVKLQSSATTEPESPAVWLKQEKIEKEIPEVDQKEKKGVRSEPKPEGKAEEKANEQARKEHVRKATAEKRKVEEEKARMATQEKARKAAEEKAKEQARKEQVRKAAAEKRKEEEEKTRMTTQEKTKEQEKEIRETAKQEKVMRSEKEQVASKNEKNISDIRKLRDELSRGTISASHIKIGNNTIPFSEMIQDLNSILEKISSREELDEFDEVTTKLTNLIGRNEPSLYENKDFKNLKSNFVKTQMKVASDLKVPIRTEPKLNVEEKESKEEIITNHSLELIRQKVIEVPSYMKPEQFVEYLLGKKELNEFLKNKSGQRFQGKPAVGTHGDHHRLMRDLQSSRVFLTNKETQIQEKQIQEDKLPPEPIPQRKGPPPPPAPKAPPAPPAITPDVVQKRLQKAADEGLVMVNKPISNTVEFLFGASSLPAERRVDADFLKRVKGEKQMGRALENKEMFLSHIKKFKSVKKTLEAEKKEKPKKPKK